VIPFLIGIMMDLYVFMPLRLSNIDETMLDIYLTVVSYILNPYQFQMRFNNRHFFFPTPFFLKDWALGLAGLSIFYGIVNLVPANGTFRALITQFNWNNLGNLNIRDTNFKVIVPTVVSLCVIILTPSILTLLTIRLFGKFFLLEGY
jgi:hypothetical protein